MLQRWYREFVLDMAILSAHTGTNNLDTYSSYLPRKWSRASHEGLAFTSSCIYPNKELRFLGYAFLDDSAFSSSSTKQ
jgi:hypothetical protein